MIVGVFPFGFPPTRPTALRAGCLIIIPQSGFSRIMYFSTKRTPLQRRPIVSENFMGTAEIQTVTMKDREETPGKSGIPMPDTTKTGDMNNLLL